MSESSGEKDAPCMAHTASYPLAPSAPLARETARRESIPWYMWCCVVALSLGAFGGVWDISWHESVGRDTFWTPAHLMIYLCGVLAGLACGYLILATTFQKD